MSNALQNKHIILGITGGIAAYKSAILARLLVKARAEVQVIMTPNAKEFITPLTLSTLTGKPVISEFFTANTGQWNSHVDLGLWADAFVVAPATASSIAKMANGVADNMLITTYLSAKCPVFIAPAMDLDMMRHPSTLRNIALLKSYGHTIIEPAEGELASHLVGKGRMEEPHAIAHVLEIFFESKLSPDSHKPISQTQLLKGKKVLITAGPTYERIDPVRFIGNFSSGKMGYAIAAEAARQGADVTLVSGPVGVSINTPAVNVVSVESASQMMNACSEFFPTADVAIMSAAVSDFAPAEVLPTKLKRENKETLTVNLVKNPDIAATLGHSKRPGQVVVGFALETDNESENAFGKLERKKLDMVVLNSLRVEGAGFQTDTNQVSLCYPNGTKTDFPLKSKTEVASDIIAAIAQLLRSVNK